jgi:hypothetical protein
MYQRLSGPLIVDPAALMSVGWTPRLATRDGLAMLMRASGT